MRTLVREDYFAILYDAVEKIREESKGGDIKLQIVGRRIKEIGNKPVAMLEIELTGYAIIRGWQLIACLRHTNRGNVIELFVDVPREIYTQWYTIPPRCDHCGVDRKRNVTYIVRNIATDSLMQVGESCLVKYNGGRNINDTVAIKRALGLLSPERLESLYHRKPAPVFYIPDIVAGYVLGLSHYSMGVCNKLNASQTEFIANMEKWVESLDDSIVENHNMKVLAQKDFVRKELYADVCKIVDAYKYALDAPRREANERLKQQRRLEQERERLEQEREQLVAEHSNFRKKATEGYKTLESKATTSDAQRRQVSEFLGAVDDKVSTDTLKLRITDVAESMYGGDYGKVTFVDVKGNVILWCTSVDKLIDKLKALGVAEVPTDTWIDIPLKLSGIVKSCFYGGAGGKKITRLKNCKLKKGTVTEPIYSEDCISSNDISENLKLARSILSQTETVDGYKNLLDTQLKDDYQSKCPYEIDSDVCIDVVSIRETDERFGRRSYILKDTFSNLYIIRVHNDLFNDLCILPLGKIDTPLIDGYKLKGKVHTYLTHYENNKEIKMTELWYGKVEKS